MNMNIYVMVLFPTFVIFEGVYMTLEDAEEHIAATAGLRPSAEQRIVRTEVFLPIGRAIEFTTAVDLAASTS